MIWLVMVFVPDVLRIAPISVELVMPSPEIVNGSSIVKPSEMFRVAFDATVVEPAVVPSAVALEIATTPASTDVAPVYVFAAVKVSVLADEVDFVSAPSPEMTPDSL